MEKKSETTKRLGGFRERIRKGMFLEWKLLWCKRCQCMGSVEATIRMHSSIPY